MRLHLEWRGRLTLRTFPLDPPPQKTSEWFWGRAPLDGGSGVHHIFTEDERGLGLWVSGFGFATSYYYPGGTDLALVSEPPVIVE